jgi:DNA-binding NtrC family response regulator
MAKRLLLVHHRRGIARTIRSIAPDLDLEVIALDDVEQAATRVAELRPDLVVLDVRIAHNQLAELLRNIVQTGTDSKIVMTTRSDDPATRVAEGLARFHVGDRLSFLRRPFHRGNVQATLRSLLEDTASLAVAVVALGLEVAEQLVPEWRAVSARVPAACDQA